MSFALEGSAIEVFLVVRATLGFSSSPLSTSSAAKKLDCRERERERESKGVEMRVSKSVSFGSLWRVGFQKRLALLPVAYHPVNLIVSSVPTDDTYDESERLIDQHNREDFQLVRKTSIKSNVR